MKIFLIVSFIFVFLMLTLFVWYYFLTDKGDLKKSKKEFEIFGLSECFVPQGITYLEKQKKFLISGYVSKQNLPSRIYVVDAETYNFEKYVTLQFVGGKVYKGHAGGITNFGDSGWVSSDGYAYRFLISDLLNAKNESSIRIIDNLKSHNKADFCFVSNGLLWLGEFYKLGKIKTDSSHHLLNEDGCLTHSLAFGYPLSKCVTCGVEGRIPEKALTLPDMAQGVVIADGKVFVSTSFSLSKSNVFVYENVFLKKPQKHVVVEDKKVDLWELNSKYLKKTHTFPEMSEEIEWVDGRLFIVFKSAAKKYRIFARTSINHVFSIK